MRSILDFRDLFVAPDVENCSPYVIWKFLRDKLLPLLERGRLEAFDFHGDGDGGRGDDPATRYVCHLPDSREACARTREGLRLAPARRTKTGTLHADRIATAAWDRGLYKNAAAAQKQRKQIREIVAGRMRGGPNSSSAELPLECLPGDILSESAALSVRIGKEMLGDNRLNATALMEKFARNEAERKFCSVNVTAILSESDWKQFFRRLNVST